MGYRSSNDRFGVVRTPSQVAVMKACEELIVAFCDLVDAGDLDGALGLHLADAIFNDVNGAKVCGHERIAAWLSKVRLSYPGRSTLHVPSNLRFARVTESEAECRVIIALYDLTKLDGDKIAYAARPSLRRVVAEAIRFSLGPSGDWRFRERSLSFLTGDLPTASEATA